MIFNADESFFVVSEDMALKSLCPNAKYHFHDGQVVWEDANIAQPTKEQIQAQITLMEQQNPKVGA